MERQALRIERAISIGVADLTESTTKTLKLRTVSLDPGTVDAIQRLLDSKGEAAERKGVTRVADPFLCSTSLAGDVPYDPNSMSSMWAQWRLRLDPSGGLGHVRFGHLRHFAATEMIYRRQNIVEVARRLGHSNAATTLRFYAHEMPLEDQAMAQQLADAMFPAGLT